MGSEMCIRDSYQLSMTIEELKGVTNVDEKVSWKHPTKDEPYEFTLRMILLYYLKMQDGHAMVAEVHQKDPCKTTDIIIPHAEEAEQMIGMMNKNFAAFLHHMPLAQDFKEEVIKLLITKRRSKLLRVWLGSRMGLGLSRRLKKRINARLQRNYSTRQHCLSKNDS